MTTEKDREKRLSKAKTALILDHPFIGMIALNMPFEVSTDLPMPTAATNGKWVRFHPEFMDKLTDQELTFVVAHEIFHPVFQHITRRQHRNPLLWNIAGDVVINRMLIEDNVGKPPKGIIDMPDIYKNGNGITDKIYELLMEEVEKNGKKFTAPGTGNGTGSIDICEDAAAGSESEMEQEWKQRVAGAAQAAKMQGNLSANQQRFVDALVNPKVDWRDVLQRFVVKFRNDERTFARPNRRFISQGLYMPTSSGEAMGEMLVAIDCSGSIGQKELNEFAAEIRKIKEDTNPLKIHVTYFDSQVCHYDCFGRDDDLVIAPHGGGGTAFSPIFKYAAEHDINPVCCVVLTDLYCSDFGNPTEYPVLWVTNGAKEAPWGEIVEM